MSKRNRGGGYKGPSKQYYEKVYVPKDKDPENDTENKGSYYKKTDNRDQISPPEDNFGSKKDYYETSSYQNKHYSEKNKYTPKNDVMEDGKNNYRPKKAYKPKENYDKDEKNSKPSGMLPYYKANKIRKQENRKIDEDDPTNDEGVQETKNKVYYQWKECVVCLLKCNPNTPIWSCSDCKIT